MPDDQTNVPQTVGDSGKTTILLVEDDPFLVKMYKEKFEIEGFNVLVAEDGVEGLKLATQGNIDIIILDILIPKLSGIDLLTRLKNNPKAVNVPILVLTNLTQKEEEVKLLPGVKEYLVKSDYTPSQVVEKIRMYLGK